MHEGIKTKSPWAVEAGDPVAELEFERKTLKDFHAQLKNFAKKEGLNYDIEENKSSILLTAEPADYDILLKQVEKMVVVVNEMLDYHKKAFRLRLHVIDTLLTVITEKIATRN